MAFKYKDLIPELEKLRRFARKLTRNQDDAEDLLQTTVLKAMENREKFEEGSNMFGWLSKIMFNTFATAYRRRVKFETQYDCQDLILSRSVDASQDKEIELKQTGEALERLSEDHRDIIVMVCMQGMAYQDVSEMLNIPVGTVRSRLSRAREHLKSMLAANTDAGFAMPVSDGAADQYLAANAS
jgi:RNA polymerase sigma-70 factor (ECF subfamily)